MGSSSSLPDSTRQGAEGAATEPEPPLEAVLREIEGGINTSDRKYYLRTYR